MKKTIISLLICLPVYLIAQNSPKKCGTDELFYQILDTDPGFKTQWINAHKQASQTAVGTPSHLPPDRMQILMNPTLLDSLYQATLGQEITIPIVVHVIAPSEDHPANISMDQIRSQIRELNRAFSQDNYPVSQNFPPYWSEAYADDSRIRFCLASRDPEGKPTRGVTRTYTSVPDFPPCEFDDLVDDTPEQAAPNYGCSPFTTTCDGQRDMLPNFMNYSADDCNVFFTKGQVRRMRATLNPGGFRFKLPYSEKGCSYP